MTPQLAEWLTSLRAQVVEAGLPWQEPHVTQDEEGAYDLTFYGADKRMGACEEEGKVWSWVVTRGGVPVGPYSGVALKNYRLFLGV